MARVLAVAGLAALLPALVLAPESMLRAFWYGLIPLLPALFLVHPGLWRNVCPMATLNMVADRLSWGRRQPPRSAPALSGVGIALFAALVPARRFLFELDGRATAVAATGFGIAALALGLVFDRKAGFCNAICPLLPVERLYGQAPLLQVSNPRCDGCSLCTPRGCIDLAADKSIAQVLGRARHSAGWLLQPFGVFAAAFPGFVLGYYLAPAGGMAIIGTVYLTVGLAALISYLFVGWLAVGGKLSADALLPACAAVAAALFYGLGAGGIARAWGWGTPGAWAVRCCALGLVGLWLLRRSSRAPDATRQRVADGGVHRA
jgi:hypothetical protein